MIAGWPDPPSTVVCVGAHPDDIEIGAAGLLLRLATIYPAVDLVFLLLTGTSQRVAEAEKSAARLIPGRIVVRSAGFRDGYLPFEDPAAAKEWVASHVDVQPDLVISHHLGDLHQDHRFASEVTWQVFRDATIFEYEVPKWEGDRPECNFLVALDNDTIEVKVSHLMDNFPSQHSKPWYDRAVFEGMARLRGVEAGVDFAEGFTVRKLKWS